MIDFFLHVIFIKIYYYVEVDGAEVAGAEVDRAEVDVEETWQDRFHDLELLLFNVFLNIFRTHRLLVVRTAHL